MVEDKGIIQSLNFAIIHLKIVRNIQRKEIKQISLMVHYECSIRAL